MDLIGEAGTAVPMHSHEWGQLLLVAGGAVSIETGSGQWLIAPSRSVWVPLFVEHRLSIHRCATLRFLYLNPGCCSNLPTTSRVIKVSALLRELLSEAIRRAPICNNSSGNNTSDNNTGSARLCDLLVDLTRACALAGIELLMPLDSRARTVARRIQDPACLARPLDDLVADSGASR